MMIVMTPATTHVPVRTPSNGTAPPFAGVTVVRMIGFRKMMYAITMNVVTPAIVSRARVVPCSAKRKRRSRSEPSDAAAAMLAISSSRKSGRPGFVPAAASMDFSSDGIQLLRGRDAQVRRGLRSTDLQGRRRRCRLVAAAAGHPVLGDGHDGRGDVL